MEICWIGYMNHQIFEHFLMMLYKVKKYNDEEEKYSFGVLYEHMSWLVVFSSIVKIQCCIGLFIGSSISSISTT